MPEYTWPDAEHRTLIGKRTTRVDSAVKVSGQAKYTYDVHRPGMLYGKVLRCPYAHAKVVPEMRSLPSPRLTNLRRKTRSARLR